MSEETGTRTVFASPRKDAQHAKNEPFDEAVTGASERAAHMTPVPGGVGPMTIACLLQNAVACARLRRA